MMQTLKGKTALITGGNSGIGYATAKELKAQGATIIITGRREAALKAAAETLGVQSILADQASVAAIEQLAAQVKERYGKIDILFINAGIVNTSSIEMATEQVFDEIMAVNFKGAYFTLSRFIPLLNQGASVVLLSSNTASMHKPDSSIYSSSKAALNAIMKVAAAELAPRGIRVNAVSPGPTETEIFHKMGIADPERLHALKQSVIALVPLAKMGAAADVGKMVAHLSGDAAGFVTGAEFLMDGGMSL